MYNAVTNNWQNFEHQITFDVRQPKTHKKGTRVVFSTTGEAEN